MNKVLETKSQMIMRIAELSEANEQLEAEIEKQKRELCQRYEEPEFATFLLMGKTAKEWQNIQKENERLKEENEKLNKMTGIFSARLCEKYSQALQEIMRIVRKETETRMLFADKESFCDFCKIQDVINKTIGVENER